MRSISGDTIEIDHVDVYSATVYNDNYLPKNILYDSGSMFHGGVNQIGGWITIDLRKNLLYIKKIIQWFPAM